MSASTVVVLLGLLLGLQPVTTDVYLPALPALQHELAASMSQVQLTFAGLLLAFGCSQLVWGPLSDRFGRRPVLLWGMGAYLLASLASALAPSMPLLIAARVAQGAAMGAAVMCARAIVRDLYEPLEGARMMSRGLSGLGVIAITCAPLGGLLTELIRWRAALAALALFGALTLALVALRFHETIPARNPRALAPGTLWQAWRRIARHPTFVTYSLLATASYAALFTFLSTSPFVLIEALGMSRFGYGALMAAGSLVYIAGTVACRRLLLHCGIRRAVFAAGWVTFAAGLLMAGLACGEVSLLAWDILAAGADAFATVSDDAAVQAMRLLAAPTGGDAPIVAGESAVAGLAAAIALAQVPAQRAALGIDARSRLLLFGSEGATDPALYAQLVGRTPQQVLAGQVR